MYDFETARFKMLENQLLGSEAVSYDVALGVASIPREIFLPETMKSKSYLDDDIIVSNDYFLISALSLAKLVEVAEVNSNDVVLDLGCGCGYSSAVMAKFAAMVVGVDKNKDYEEIATRNFAELSVDNAVMITTDTPELGLKKQAPYNLIMVSGMLEDVPEVLLEQLADGGRLVTACCHNDNRYGTGAFSYGEITKVIRKGRAFDKKVYSDILLPLASVKFFNK
ncbi:MAG: protein-L-isoaspartate O-methyltransferase [Alphaproteobacteria bacterium]